jgi:hypothetical protein
VVLNYYSVLVIKGKTHLAGRWASASFTPDLLADVEFFSLYFGLSLLTIFEK